MVQLRGKIMNVFREKSAAFIFVLGLMVSSFILINVGNLIDKINMEKQVVENYKYSIMCNIHYNGMVQDKDVAYASVFDEIINYTKGNIFVETFVNVNEGTKYTANILIKQNEDLNLKYKLLVNNNFQNEVIIGESLVDDTTISEGVRTIQIENSWFQVVGIMENQMSAGIDNSIYVLWDSCNDEVKNNLFDTMKDEYTNIFFKSQQDISMEFNNFTDKVSEAGLRYDIYNAEYAGSDYQNYVYQVYNKLFLGISFVFSVFNCFAVSSLWIINRKKELAIRKTYGYSIVRIAGLVLSDIWKLSIPATLLAVVVQIIYGAVAGETLLGGHILLKVLFVSFGMIIVTILTTIWHLYYIGKVPPVAVLAEN